MSYYDYLTSVRKNIEVSFPETILSATNGIDQLMKKHEPKVNLPPTNPTILTIPTIQTITTIPTIPTIPMKMKLKPPKFVPIVPTVPIVPVQVATTTVPIVPIVPIVPVQVATIVPIQVHEPKPEPEIKKKLKLPKPITSVMTSEIIPEPIPMSCLKSTSEPTTDIPKPRKLIKPIKKIEPDCVIFSAPVVLLDQDQDQEIIIEIKSLKLKNKPKIATKCNTKYMSMKLEPPDNPPIRLLF